MLQIDLPFPHSYEVEELGELPGTGRFDSPLIYFSQLKNRREHDGLWLRVKANEGRSWIGIFAFGYTSPPAFSRVVSSPDPNRVCVIAKGSAYIVSAAEPEVWEQIPITPVLHVQPLLDHKLLLFSDFIRMAAYGSGGLAWRSPRVCWDGLKVTNVTNDTIEGIGYDPTNSITHELHFVVDVKTGRSLLPSPVSVDDEPIW